MLQRLFTLDIYITIYIITCSSGMLYRFAYYRSNPENIC